MNLIVPLAQADPDAAEGFTRDPGSGGSGCPGNNGICPGWAVENFDRYIEPTLEHLVLVVASVGLGFAIAFGLALLSHRYRWLVPPLIGGTGVLYTIPSLAFFFLLLPITGRGTDTAIIALTAYTLQIIYRNMVAGLANVPEASKVAIATLAAFAGAGGLGEPILTNLTFKTNILLAGGLAILMAVSFDLIL